MTMNPTVTAGTIIPPCLVGIVSQSVREPCETDENADTMQQDPVVNVAPIAAVAHYPAVAANTPVVAAAARRAAGSG